MVRRSAGPRDDAYDVAVLDTMRSERIVVPPRLRNRFTVRYATALLMVALLASVAAVTITRLVDTQASAAAQINVSGRQRMLSQRIALQAGLLSGDDRAAREATRATMTADVESMAAGQRGLLHGDPARNLPGHPNAAVTSLFARGTRDAVSTFLGRSRVVLARAQSRAVAPEDPEVQLLQAQARGPLLVALDQIVTAYQHESEQRVAAILRQEQALLLLTLLTLLAEAFLVFRPMSRRIERETQRLEAVSARHRADAERHAFDLRLREAIDLTDNEATLAATVLHAVRTAEVAGEAELLLTPDGVQLQATQPRSATACSVASLQGCPALRRGRTMSFLDSDQLGACPQLRADVATAGDSPRASTCVPVTFLGNSIGVLRAVTPAQTPQDEEVQATLETVASTAGTHLGTLRALAQSRADAERDAMTGLLNRRGLENAVVELDRQRTPYAVIVADLDHFKGINDTFGHETGDQVLIDSAHAMGSVLRPRDLLARHGGEEFVVVMPLTGEGSQDDVSGTAAGLAVAERIRMLLADRHALNEGASCTVSLGVCGPVASGLDSALRLADAALYRAKAGGRNRVETADAPLGTVPDDLSTTELSLH